MDSSILKNKNILIVDDYEVNTELLSIFVADAGANPLTASNGLECIEIVKKQHVDMILMDSNMPVMNGLDTTRELRLLPQGKDLIIVGISGNDNESDDKACLDAGMNCVVAKLTLNDKKLINLAASLLQHTPDASTENESNHSVTQHHETSSVTPNQIMDYKKALSEFENDRELLNSIIVEFNKITHSNAETMKQALDASNYVQIQQESHGIKGGAANLCAMPLSDAAKALENACRTNAQPAEIAKLFDIFMIALSQFDTFVNNQLEKL
jgi:CheY-like chemotaxis protein/HPt (histidine-containing phosphotransfer) domain-containing protein